MLGTSGIVEPMSEEAIIESIRLELKQKRNQGKKSIIITPGNYGADFVRELIDIRDEEIVKCSNYVGMTIDILNELEYEEVLFISHIGKFVKVAGGIMNTHSREADSRMEILAAAGIMAGLAREDAEGSFLHKYRRRAFRLERKGANRACHGNFGRQDRFLPKQQIDGRFKSGAIVFSKQIRHTLQVRSCR